ncbi:MAG: hypothetical protein M3209_02005 [Acidobacteriota bacterium]|nr:hypothetical protein [Acidobacteriota bacterium]
MSKTLWVRKTIAASLASAVFMTSSMFAIAAPGDQPQLAELTVSGASLDGDAPFVSVNGERAFSGRTIQSATTITTPATSSATVNLGKLGRVEIAPNSNFVLNFNEKGITGNLITGNVRVVGGENSENSIQTKDSVVVADQAGDKAFTVDAVDNATRVSSESGTVALNSNGKSTTVNAGQTQTTGQTQDTDTDAGSGNVALYALVFGAAAAVLVYVAVSDNNELQFGGNSTTVSPNR